MPIIFTDRVRMVLQMARAEAARLHHESARTEHLLLGLMSTERLLLGEALLLDVQKASFHHNENLDPDLDSTRGQ